VFVCVCVCVCVYICILRAAPFTHLPPVCICVCVCVCMCTYLCVCACVCVYMYTYTHTRTHIFALFVFMHRPPLDILATSKVSIHKIIGLFSRISSLLQGYFAKDILATSRVTCVLGEQARCCSLQQEINTRSMSHSSAPQITLAHNRCIVAACNVRHTSLRHAHTECLARCLP